MDPFESVGSLNSLTATCEIRQNSYLDISEWSFFTVTPYLARRRTLSLFVVVDSRVENPRMCLALCFTFSPANLFEWLEFVEGFCGVPARAIGPTPGSGSRDYSQFVVLGLAKDRT